MLNKVFIVDYLENTMNLSTTIEKNTLLVILKENKENHIKLYKDALEGSKKKFQKELKEKIEKVAKNDWTFLGITYSPPVSHAKEYEKAIKCVELNVNSTIELDMTNFNNLVMDEWGWSSVWSLQNSDISPLVSGFAVSKGYLNG